MSNEWEKLRKLQKSPDRGQIKEELLYDVLTDNNDRLDGVLDVAGDVRVLYVNGTTGDDSYDGLSATVDSVSTGPKKTVNGALLSIPVFSRNETYIKIADGTYAETLSDNLARLMGASIFLIGGYTVEHTGTVSNYLDSGLNPSGFHQIDVASITLDSTDEAKWFILEWQDGVKETIKILKVLDSNTAEVGAIKRSGKTAANYKDVGSGGQTVSIKVVDVAVTIGGSTTQYAVKLDGGIGATLKDSQATYTGGVFFCGIQLQTGTTGSLRVSLYLNSICGPPIRIPFCRVLTDYTAIYVVQGTAEIYSGDPRSYARDTTIFDSLTDSIYNSSLSRCGAHIKSTHTSPTAIHCFHSPRAWMNLRSCVLEGALYIDWQTRMQLYPQTGGLVIKKSGNNTVCIRNDDAGGLALSGQILLDGSLLLRANSKAVQDTATKIEWRASTGASPVDIQTGATLQMASDSTWTIDHSFAGAAISIADSPLAHLPAVTVSTHTASQILANIVRSKDVRFVGVFTAPTQDYGAAPASGIVVADQQSDVSFATTATGKNTNVGTSSPLVQRRGSRVILPASGYALQDAAAAVTTYLGSTGATAVPASGASKNDCAGAGTEEGCFISTL